MRFSFNSKADDGGVVAEIPLRGIIRHPVNTFHVLRWARNAACVNVQTRLILAEKLAAHAEVHPNFNVTTTTTTREETE